jgi:hypothetical protein
MLVMDGVRHAAILPSAMTARKMRLGKTARDGTSSRLACLCERRPGMPQIARRARRRGRSAVPGSRWRRVSARARVHRSSPKTGDRGFESMSLQRRVSCEPRSSRSAQAASVAIDESVRRDPQPDVGDPRARTAAVSRCHRCTICCDSGRPADQCENDTDVAGSRGDLGMRRSCPTKQSRRHRSAGTPRVSPSFFFRVPEKTAGHQRVAFPIDS